CLGFTILFPKFPLFPKRLHDLLFRLLANPHSSQVVAEDWLRSSATENLLHSSANEDLLGSSAAQGKLCSSAIVQKFVHTISACNRYVDRDHAYWIGFFTKSPSVALQLEFLVGRKSGGPNTFSLGDALGIAQHHDAMIGTVIYGGLVVASGGEEFTIWLLFGFVVNTSDVIILEVYLHDDWDCIFDKLAKQIESNFTYKPFPVEKAIILVQEKEQVKLLYSNREWTIVGKFYVKFEIWTKDIHACPKMVPNYG
uniref:Uncharacterized protein n=1 Tax=Cucumis melo TaxID=3656 RepID=A0A9I9EFV2_CUCME